MLTKNEFKLNPKIDPMMETSTRFYLWSAWQIL